MKYYVKKDLLDRLNRIRYFNWSLVACLFDIPIVLGSWGETPRIYRVTLVVKGILFLFAIAQAVIGGGCWSNLQREDVPLFGILSACSVVSWTGLAVLSGIWMLRASFSVLAVLHATYWMGAGALLALFNYWFWSLEKDNRDTLIEEDWNHYYSQNHNWIRDVH